VVAISTAATEGQGGSGQTTEGGRVLHLNYYDGYAHIYWRLNWMRKAILNGSIPSDFARSVALTRRQLEELTHTIQRDGNYTVADRALTHLENGVNHLRADQALQQTSASIYAAPWVSGRETMQIYIDQGRLGFGGKPLGQSSFTPHRHHDSEDDVHHTTLATGLPTPTLSLSSAQRRAVSIALEYAEKYHASPQEKMRSEWKQAIEQINKLRDQLWLMNRRENSDGDATDVNPMVGQTTLESDHSPGSFSRSTLYDQNGTDLPPIYGTEPADPFIETPDSGANPAGKSSSK
jgi:hypothetical protein